MSNPDLPHIQSVIGLDRLSDMLALFHENAQSSSKFAATPCYILFQLNTQKSLIKVDFSAVPYEIWYADTHGRPAIQPIKQLVAEFMANTMVHAKKGELRDIPTDEILKLYFHDFYDRHKPDLLQASIAGESRVKEFSEDGLLQELVKTKRRFSPPPKTANTWLSFLRPKDQSVNESPKPKIQR